MQRPTAQEWTAAVEPNWNWTAEYDALVDGFARGCELAAGLGLKVAVEPHPYRWVSSGQGMARLIERVGAPNLGMKFDPSHLFPAGDMPHYVVLSLGDRIFNTHFSDNEGHTNAHWRPGRGDRLESHFRRLAVHLGHTGAITLELEDVAARLTGPISGKQTRQFDSEIVRGIRYLRECAAELDISIA